MTTCVKMLEDSREASVGGVEGRLTGGERCSQCRGDVVQRSRRQNDISFNGSTLRLVLQHPIGSRENIVLPQRKSKHRRSPNVETDSACSVALIAKLFGRSPVVEFRESHAISMGFGRIFDISKHMVTVCPLTQGHPP